MRFDDALRRLEAELDLPYPERAELLAEIAGDLDAAWAAARRRGRSDADARRDALRALGLDREARDALADVHRPAIGRLLHRLRPRARAAAEWSAAVTPLAALLLYLIAEVPMVHFIQQGGFANYLILLVGGIAVITATRRAFLWLGARDHSAGALGLDDSTPIHLALLTFVIGVGGTGTGFYKVMSLWNDGEIDAAVARIGFMEASTPVIMASMFASLAILVHLTARTLLRRTGAPRP